MTNCLRLIGRGGWNEDRLLGRCTFPIGPRNTWSNVAYPFAGVWLLTQQHDASAIVMAVTLCVLGIGSGLYHGYKAIWANNLDRFGMYAVFGAMGAHGLHAGPLGMAITGLSVAAICVYAVPSVNLDLQTGLLLSLSLLTVLRDGNVTLGLVSMGLFLLAFACWQLDKAGKWLGPWGHALWHVITAPAIVVMYLAQHP
jgi:hypothetical protein